MAKAAELDLSVFRTKAIGPPCGVARSLQLLEGHDRALLEAALAEPTITHASIQRWLRERVPDCPAAQTIGRHRSKECACER